MRLRMEGQGRIVAEILTYDDFLAALRAWIYELDTNYSCISDLAGLQDGYLGKLLAHTPSRNFGRTSLGSVLGALGLKLLLVTDDEKLRAMRPRYVRRKKHASDDACNQKSRSLRFNASLASLLGHRRALILSPARRKAIAQTAARARWGNRVRAESEAPPVR
jgi:hypothetical protein